MKAFRRNLAVAAALVLALASPSGLLQATGPMITVTPATITAGGAATVSGSGFAAGENVNVLGPSFSAGATADGSGNFSAPATRGDPRLPAGTYLVVATGQTSGTSATSTLAVTAASPSLSVSPSSVTQGGTFTANASGFEASEKVCFGGEKSTSTSNCVAADSTGNATTLLRIPPDQPAGSGYVVSAVGQSTLRIAFLTIAVTAASPSLSVTVGASPATSVSAGQTVTATASGFATENVLFNGGPFSGSTTGVPASSGTASESFVATCNAVSGTGTQFTGVAQGLTSGLIASTQLTIAPIGSASVSPTSQAAGSSVTVTGSGFVSTDSFNVIGPFSAALSPVTGASPTASPTIAGGLQPGTYTIWLRNTGASGSSQCSASTTLTVSDGSPAPLLTLTAPSLVTGQTVTVSGGSAFSGTVTVSVPFGSSVTTTAATGGSISTTFTIPPNALPGTYSVMAADTSGHFANAPLTINAGPSLTFSQTPVPEGKSVTLTASNFTPSHTVTFKMPGLSTSGVTATVGSTGVAQAPVTVQYGPFPGTYYAFAEDSAASTSVSAAVTLTRATPAITTSTSASAGSSLTITGTGFGPGEVVNIGGPICSSLSACPSPSTGSTTAPATATADSTGGFAAVVVVPYFVEGGLHHIHASGVTSGLDAALSITITALAPAISVAPTSAAPGATVTVSGTGFAGNESVSVHVPLQADVSATASSGSFSASFVVSSCMVNGTYALHAFGQKSGFLDPAIQFAVSGGSTTVPNGCGVVATPTPTPGPTATATPAPASAPAPAPTAFVPPTVSTSVVSVLSTAGITVNIPPVPAAGVAAAPAAVPVPLAALAQGALVLPVSAQLTQAVLNQVLVAPAPVAVSAAVNTAQGGVIVAGNVAVTLPPQAFAAALAPPSAPGQPSTPANVNVAVTIPKNVPVPGGPSQFSPNGTVLDISITNASTGQAITTFPVPVPVSFKYNAADVGQANGHAENLTAAYVIDANSPALENPLHFPAGTFVIFPPSVTTRDLKSGVITVNTQAIGSILSVVTNPVGYVQTVNPTAQLQSSFDPNASQSFGAVSQFSYLQVVEPQIGTRLLVLNPSTGNYAYVNATDVGPSGPPPAQSTTAVVRGLLGP